MKGFIKIVLKKKEKNIIQMVNYYFKENINGDKNGMEKDMMKKVIKNIK